MSAEADAWAVAARSEASRSSVMYLSLPLINAIDNVLHGKLSSDEAAQMLATQLGPTIRTEPRDWTSPSSLKRLWTWLGDAARACGKVQANSEKLADIVVSIALMGELQGDDGRPVINAEGATYWKDLPFFDLEIRESIAPEWFNGLGLEEESDLWVRWQIQAEPMLNATTFVGFLLNRMPFEHEPLLSAVWLCLNSSLVVHDLEADLPINQGSQHVERRLDQRSHFITVASAATMILVACERIWQVCQSGRILNNGRQFDESRWSLWTQSFAARSKVNAFPFDVRKLCDHAQARMEQVHEETKAP